jgi:Spy/CpxP family protein refolding chaperone
VKGLSTSPLRIAGVLALVASLSGSAFAQGRPALPGFPPGLAEARLIRTHPEEIGVGEETLAKLEKLVAEIRAKDEELQGKTVEARKAVQALLDQSRPDEKELIAAVGAAQAVARQTREHVVRSTLRIRALLTKKQLEKFMEVRKNAFTKRRGGGRPRGRR